MTPVDFMALFEETLREQGVQVRRRIYANNHLANFIRGILDPMQILKRWELYKLGLSKPRGSMEWPDAATAKGNIDFHPSSIQHSGLR